MTNSGELIAINGTFVYNAVGEKVMDAASYYVSSDAVISRIEINGDTVTDATATYIEAAGTKVDGGTLITARNGAYFSAITLESGTVVILLK